MKARPTTPSFALVGWLTMASASSGLWSTAAPDPIEQWLEAIRNVGPEGRGNLPAATAWRHVSQLPVRDITRILVAMDGASPLALNWLSSAVDAVTQHVADRPETLPVQDLGQFLLQTQHHPRARFLAFELIAQHHPAAAQQLVPGLLGDPGVELRRLAVQNLLNQAGDALAQDAEAALLLYRQALHFARDIDQIQGITDALNQHNQKVDLPRHLGFLMDWRVIGPFQNTEGRGFNTAFPPESQLKFDAQYPGKTGPVRWKQFRTSHPYGLVDFNKAFDYLKEVTAYAYTEFLSDVARPAELRLGCKNAWKIWCNGRYLFGRDEYHRGMEIDQYRMPIQLLAGTNTILVKICQNEEVEDWTREWEFQLRVCDATGTALLSTNRDSATPNRPPQSGP